MEDVERSEIRMAEKMDDGKWKIRILTYCDLGFIDYKEAWDLQQEIHSKRVSGEVDDILFLT